MTSFPECERCRRRAEFAYLVKITDLVFYRCKKHRIHIRREPSVVKAIPVKDAIVHQVMNG